MSTNEEDLQDMLAHADEQLEDLLTMGKSVGARLDYSLESIKDLEQILLQTNASPDGDEDLFYDAWLYTGIAVQRATKGQWIISQQDDDTHDLPIIKYGDTDDFVFCPLLAVEHFLTVKEKGAILSSLTSPRPSPKERGT